MKKQIVLITAMVFTISVLVSGCSQKKAVDTTAAAVTTSFSPETDSQKEVAVSPSEESESHNENLDAAELQKFAENVQDIISKKDLSALADLCDYPLFLNGEEIADKEAFLKLDADKFFSQELQKSISEADPSSLEIFGAGAALGDSQTVFINEINGKLGITSITTE
ncbi:hypothetical protein GPL15_00525 [Clostridium sp. MCC353]|uniref:hypothetical protein n=1 Tax=Clostridium sp. MCC353 TaxID=2592646 RepID=UPI001C035E63|nr:hypothetical protein [Clostridium sp. MCC353]MBT9774992.1 hypothetical protein [Clostridium sp. MCC353]